ncbi:Eco57I restriction-modification methylase domain-containing protein [Emticicia sp.]|uniref:Eco57I restriction-modification methylase domain-containing protein n=1 Tax=Emticicia sp. TaxID=1930953 RepID=UPI003750ACC0
MTYEQIHNLFKQRYNQSNWKQFLGEAFAKSRLLATPEILTGIDSNVASQVQKLGYITLNENGIERQIAVYEVTLAQGIILERNRVGLRNLLRKYWKDIDAAFIAYHRPETPNWRFTYVSELTGYDAAGEFVKIKTEPKRYTYVLGEGESNRTAAERFTAIASKGSKATLDDVKEAFSVEKLSKAFFDEYKKHYDIFCDFMVSKPNIRQTIFNGDEKGIRDFNKKLLGRIVFLYFIQKKGWLGVPKNEDWGKGDFNFITQQFENIRNKDLFYQQFLSPLFFETLNQKRENDIAPFLNNQENQTNPKNQGSDNFKIPYLNGGLFEEDDKKHRNLIFPSNLFKNLFDFFNQYNFTIYEDDPNDHTVAVDPEMLGHIFENLLEDNKDKGAYYTPKEIVHYMCQESLIEYLTTWFENKGYEVVGYIGFDKPDQPKLFSANEGRKGQLVMETDNKTTGKQIDRILIEKLLKKKLDDDDKKLIKKHSAEFHNALDYVKICDPAIGSGAFPMGLLHEIFTAKQTLHTFEHGNTKTFDASGVKLNIIQNSIYGVDIEKGAVDIARLRFWLSLIVDEEKPKALPNLDYKIVVGNSLASKLGDDIIDIDWTLNETSHGLFGADLAKQKSDLLKKISKEQKEFFNPDSDKKKLAAEIRKLKIELLINQLELMISTKGIETKPSLGKKIKEQTELYLQTIGWKNSIKDLQKLKNKPEAPLDFFDWKLDFPEVMNEKVNANMGFDIVIANPPYLGEKGNKDKFRPVQMTSLGVRFYKGQMDLFYYFYHKAIDLMRPNGVSSFITTNYFITADSAIKLRNDFRDRTSFIRLVNFNELKIFETALGQHNLITLFQKNINRNFTEILLSKDKSSFNLKNISLFLDKQSANAEYFRIERSKLYEGEAAYIRFGNTSENADVASIFAKILNNSSPLENICEVNAGIGVTVSKLSSKYISKFPRQNYQNGEGVFVIDNKIASELEANIIKDFVKNSNIGKYTYEQSKDKLIYLTRNHNIEKYPKAKKHLLRYKPILDDQILEYEEEFPWYALNRPRTVEVFEDLDKIILPYRSLTNAFAYSNEPIYGSRDVLYIRKKETTTNIKYILGILNSKLIYYWLYNKGKRKGETLELYQRPVSEIPIKLFDNKYQSTISSLVAKIINLKFQKKDTTILEQEIDNLVYKLYELTYDEVIVIDPEFSLSKKEYEAIKLE